MPQMAALNYPIFYKNILRFPCIKQIWWRLVYSFFEIVNTASLLSQSGSRISAKHWCWERGIYQCRRDAENAALYLHLCVHYCLSLLSSEITCRNNPIWCRVAYNIDIEVPSFQQVMMAKKNGNCLLTSSSHSIVCHHCTKSPCSHWSIFIYYWVWAVTWTLGQNDMSL